VILPLDGTAPENTTGRDAMLAGCSPSDFGPGRRTCAGRIFLDVPAVGAAGNTDPLPNFLGINGTNAQGVPIQRLVGSAANCATITSQYCH